MIVKDEEQSICAYYLQEHDRGRALITELLARDDLPPAITQCVEANLRFYVDNAEEPNRTTPIP